MSPKQASNSGRPLAKTSRRKKLLTRQLLDSKNRERSQRSSPKRHLRHWNRFAGRRSHLRDSRNTCSREIGSQKDRALLLFGPGVFLFGEIYDMKSCHEIFARIDFDSGAGG